MNTRVHQDPCPNCATPGRQWRRGVCHPCYRRWYRVGFAADSPPAPYQGGPPDELAIEQAVAGYAITLSPAERREAARRLDQRGTPRGVIAIRLGCCVRTVERAIYPRQQVAA